MTGITDNRSISNSSNDDNSIGSRSRRSSNAGSIQGSMGRGGEEELMLSDGSDDEDILDQMYKHKKSGDEDVALVGSISHILRTLFRDLYVNPALPPGTKVTPPPVPIPEEESNEDENNDEDVIEKDEIEKEEIDPSNNEIENGVMTNDDDEGGENNDDIGEEGVGGLGKNMSKKKSTEFDEIQRPLSPGGDDDDDEVQKEGENSPSKEGEGVETGDNIKENENMNEDVDMLENQQPSSPSSNFDETMFNGTLVDEGKEEVKEEEEEVKLNANQRAAVEEMLKIDKKLAAQLAECSSTISMLKEARQNAEISDHIQENELKSRGILVSAHIPIGPSHLSRTLKEAKDKMDEMKRDESALRKQRGEEEEEKYPSLVSELISARSLMEASLNKHLYKSGNLKPERDQNTNQNTNQNKDDHSGFLKMTTSLQVRKNMVLSISHGPNGMKHDNQNQNQNQNENQDDDYMFLNEDEDEMDKMLRSAIDNDESQIYGNDHGKSSSSKNQTKNQNQNNSSSLQSKKPKARNVNEEQHDLDLKVLQRMEQKLKFTKNPRHDSSNKNNHRLLTLPPAAPPINLGGMNNNTLNDGGKDDGVNGGYTNNGQTTMKTMTGLMGPVSSPDTDQVMAIWENRKIPPPPGDHGFFVASPPIIEFTEYDVSGRYEAVVQVRNVTSVARSLTILPLTTHFFAVAKVQFPSSTQGSLAPGMAVSITVRFEPDSLADYEDHLTIKNEGYDFPIHVWAHRPPPILSIPYNLDIGACLVGDAKSITFKCKNSGGRGKFRLLCPLDFPEPRTAQRNLVSLKMDPFNVTPTEFSLNNGEEVNIIVEYIPLELGKHEASFVLLCDNCQISEYNITGESEEVALSVCEVNGGLTNTELKQLHFDPLPISAKAEQTFSLQNTTRLDLNFRWEFRPEDIDVVIGTAKNTNTNSNSNDIVETNSFNGFNIKPRRGTITANKDQLFIAEYSPLSNQINGCAAVLVVEEIPPQSVPSKQQNQLLKQLNEVGHGNLLRLEAWFNHLCNNGTVTPAKKKNGNNSENNNNNNGGGGGNNSLKVDYKTLNKALQVLNLTQHERALRDLMSIWHESSTSSSSMISLEDFLKHCPNEVAKSIEAKQARVPVLDIQKKIRRNVETIAIKLKGAGEDVVLGLTPPSIQIPGLLLVSQSYVKKVMINNYSNCSTTFSFGSPLLDSEDDPGSEYDFPYEFLDPSKEMMITVEPNQGILTACGEVGSQIEVLICLTPLKAGRIDATLPCVTHGGSHLLRRHSSINSDNISEEVVKYRSDPYNMKLGNNCFKLRIGVDAVGPRITFNQPEVDLGLMAVLGKMSVPISFTNVGAVPCAWNMSQMEISDEKQTQVKPRNTRIGGKNSYAKLQCSPENGILGPNETATTYVICECGHSPERLRSTLTCRVKGIDNTSHSEFESQFISCRGEVQAPKVYLDLSELSLGTCFIGVPVTRTVKLRNLSNLSTQFKWSRCLGPDPPGFHFKFDPPEGTIGEKQTLNVKFTMTAKTTGMLSELFTCECYGMNKPIGFELKSSVRGVVVAYEAINEVDLNLPKPLGKPTDVQYMGSTPIPVAGIVPKFNFGDTVPLFERRTIRFAIRNLSAIACPFTIQPARYKVSKDTAECEKVSELIGMVKTEKIKSKKIKGLYTTTTNNNNGVGGDRSGINSGGGTALLSRSNSFGGTRRTGSGGSNRGLNKTPVVISRLLDNSHEPQSVYQSSAGKAHIAHRLEKMEDRAVLSERNGAAFAVSPSRGMLEPWGCVVVTVTAFNEMPGIYNDDLECHLEGALLTRLSLHMAVIGCPLKLSSDCVGLDSKTEPMKPKLQFGDIINGSQDTVKLVRIRNEGPIGARVSWDVRSPDDDGDEAKDNRYVDVSLLTLSSNKKGNSNNNNNNSSSSASSSNQNRNDRNQLDKNMKKDLVSVKIKWHTRKEYTAPYSISPSSALIQPHSSANFKVTLHGDAVAYHNPIPAHLLSNTIGQNNNNNGDVSILKEISDVDSQSSIGGDDFTDDGGGGGGSIVSKGKHSQSKSLVSQSLNVDVSSLASYDNKVPIIPSMMNVEPSSSLDDNVLIKDLVEAVMVMNAEWIHDTSSSTTNSVLNKGSNISNNNNNGSIVGEGSVSSFIGKNNESQSSGGKSPARSSSPMKRNSKASLSSSSSSIQQKGKVRDQSGLTRETLGAIKVYLSATPTSPRLFLDKQVHADKNGDQFLRFSSLSTQTYSMDSIMQAIQAILPKVNNSNNNMNILEKSSRQTSASNNNMKRNASSNKMILSMNDNESTTGYENNNNISVQDLINYQLRTVVFINPLGMPLTFSISTTYPFRVLGSKCLAPPHPLHKGMMASALSTNQGTGSTPGGIFTLPPQEAVTLYVAYLPQPTPLNQSNNTTSNPINNAIMNNGQMRKQTISSAVTMPVQDNSVVSNQTVASATSSAISSGNGKNKVGELRLKTEHEGTLAISFSTGQVQQVKMVGIVSRPMVTCAPAEYGFGLVHTESGSEFLLFLSNPTEVDAKWKVVHLPVDTPKFSATYDNDSIKHTEDDPSVFSFGQLSGIQQGPCYPLVAAGASLPLDFNQRTRPSFSKSSLNSTQVSWNEHPSLVDRLKYRNELNYKEPLPIKIVFRPNKNLSYQSRFRFIVENGEGFDVVFSGKGTYEENTIPNRPPKVGPRMYDDF